MFVQDLVHCTMEFENKTNGQEVQTLLSEHMVDAIVEGTTTANNSFV